MTQYLISFDDGAIGHVRALDKLEHRPMSLFASDGAS